MQLQKQRPTLSAQTGTMPGVDPEKIKSFNQNSTMIQGYRLQIAGATTLNITPVLNGGGLFLYGCSVTTTTTSDLGDCDFTFSVNNLGYLTKVSVSQLIPNYTNGFLYFPLPVPLNGGKDTFAGTFQKYNAGTVTLYFNLFYLPVKAKQ